MPFESLSAFTSTAVLEPRPSEVPAGFDAIVQLNVALMHRALTSNLARLNLSPLSARVPYRSEQVSPGLRALIQPHIGLLDSVVAGRQVELEVQLFNPLPQSFDWPQDADPLAGSDASARVVSPRDKKVTLTWTVAVYLFRPAPPELETSAGSTAVCVDCGDESGSATGGRGPSSLFANTSELVAIDWSNTNLPPPQGSRTLLTQGTATMTVPIDLLVNGPLYQFRLAANFEGVQPAYNSAEPVMVEFLGTALAGSLLDQALAPLRLQYALSATPVIALAGGLSPNLLAQAQLPALHVNDILLQDTRGQLVALCVTLGNDSHGAFSLVKSFLAGHDFAYFTSDRVYGPIMKEVWRANAMHIPIVSDISVEMPLSEGSEQTGMGIARVQVKLSDKLDDVGLVPSVDSALGDPMRILSQQTVNLLALWDPQGNQITELGGLAEPATIPFALALQMFDKPASMPVDNTIKPPLSNTLKSMFDPLYFPIIEKYEVARLNGFTSSSMRSLVARWSLPRPNTNSAAVGDGLLAVG